MPHLRLYNFGCRGSSPSPSTPGFQTHVFGGNTTAFFIKGGPFNIGIDNGSGVRQLGQWLFKQQMGFGQTFIWLQSHYHTDHTQGLPFCGIHFIKTNKIFFHGLQPLSRSSPSTLGDTIETMLAEQQALPFFPVPFESLPAQREYQSHPALFSHEFWYGYHPRTNEYECYTTFPEGFAPENIIKITTVPVNHPDGCLGFRVDYMGESIATLSDHEPQRYPSFSIIKYCQGVDLMAADGQYTEKELAGFVQGFGHGSPKSCIEQAMAAGAKRVLIIHFDPGRSDDQLAEMEAQALRDAAELGYTGIVEFAREGRVYTCGEPGHADI